MGLKNLVFNKKSIVFLPELNSLNLGISSISLRKDGPFLLPSPWIQLLFIIFMRLSYTATAEVVPHSLDELVKIL